MKVMLISLRYAFVVVVICAGAASVVNAQAPPLVFTAATPEPTRTEGTPETSAVIEERALSLWSGASSDFGVGASISRSRWTLRSITSMTALPIGAHDRPTFQQIEVARPLIAIHSITVAGGGGVRQEWDGTRVLIGRVLAGSAMSGGRLQGSLVLERALSSPVTRDAADVVTSLGWSRPVAHGISVGLESIGQDLEGLWNSAEADGGAKLLVGPSIHVQSSGGRWSATLTAGPVMQTLSSVAPQPPARTHLSIFASGTWRPSLGR